MLKAALIMLVAMSCIPAGDVAGKLLSTSGTAPPFVAWSRFAIGALLVLPLFGRAGLALLGDWRIWLRGALLAGGISAIQMALATAPMANVFAAFFIGPIFSFVLAGLLLDEPMSRARIGFLALGFLGVVLVVRPGGGMAPGMEFAVLSGLCYGAFLTASRWLSHLGSPGALTMSQLVIGALLLAPFGALSVPEFDTRTIALVGASAFFSMLGNLLLLYAYRIATATALAPLVYLQLLAATALGWFVFNDLPDGLTWLGIALILCAGALAARRG